MVFYIIPIMFVISLFILLFVNLKVYIVLFIFAFFLTIYALKSSPIAEHPFYLLIETSGSNAEHDEEKLSNYLEKFIESGIVLDGTVTNEPGKIQVISIK